MRVCTYVAGVHVHECTRVYACAAVDIRRRRWESFLGIHLPVLEARSLKFTPGRSGWMFRKSQGSASGSTVLGRQAHSHHTQLLLLILLSVWSCFHMDPRNRTLNLNPHACKTNILLIEPTPQIFSRHVVAMFGTVTKVIENKLGRSEWCIK